MVFYIKKGPEGPNRDLPLGESRGRCNVAVDVHAVRAIALDSCFPGNDRACFNRFGVAVDGAVAIQGFVGTGRANTQDLHTQGVSHRVLLGQTQGMITSILEVGDASQRQAPGLRGGQADVETFGLVVVRNDVFGVGVSLKGCVGQAIQTECLVGAVHVERGTVHRKDAVGIRDSSARGHDIIGAGRQEVGGAGYAGKSDVDLVCCQGHDIKIKAKSRRKVRHDTKQGTGGLAGPSPTYSYTSHNGNLLIVLIISFYSSIS